MEYGICNLSIIPLRAEPNERSEQVSQILFGEAFQIIEWSVNWVKIVTLIDSYTGWIGQMQFTELSNDRFKELLENPPPLTDAAVTQVWKITDNSILYLPIGSSLSFLEGTTCYIGEEKFEVIGSITSSNKLEATAKSFINTPYLWGGRTHFGIDCSGFTQAVFRLKEITLKRDANMQIEGGKEVSSLALTKLGDLAFFNNDDGKITHVGIMLNKNHIIHASGRVKIDKIDNKGIYSEQLKRYTHTLNSIRRY